ncbi:ribosomal-protein-alanine N-acetyltransferase [Thermoproteus sp. CP80]|uniref:ribosomal protein S18-alanine N-acetyltransferase n=1 Tax=Thermoproteus sp. CP80 TaxID=1650659 RepID=UPI0009C174BA|nr:ribosomal protein S18-alanine N-acetyltransferase [Thermoproteus sp. CP80]PLC65986.1 ribosomal-protein-alanine N-acetyltransferase [Thermoproteus sp. CP80]
MPLEHCSPERLDGIYEVELDSFKKEDIYSIDLLKFLCSFCYENSYIYIENNKVLGYIITCVEGSAAHIISIAVRQEARRRGVGSALLCTALRLLKNRKVEKIYLEVRMSNKNAIDLYKKAGFQIVEVLRNYYSDGEDGYRMELTERKSFDSFCHR